MGLKILISGGGTGGHIYPGISLAREFKARDNENDILFVGTNRGLETKIIPHEGFEIKTINARGIERKLCLNSIKAVFIFFISLVQSFKILKKYQPDCVIGTGGYVSGSVVLMASFLRIPIFIHEQNAIPGITNKLLSCFAIKTFISFKQSGKYFKYKERLFFSGNPIRLWKINQITEDNYRKFRLNSSKKTILVIGGSKGAATINSAVINGIKLLQENFRNEWQVLLVSGEEDYNTVNSHISIDDSYLRVMPYIYEMSTAYRIADIIICRAGATTLAEVSAYGIPSIIIPYPFATDNHQEVNARIFEKNGAAMVILDKELTGKKLASVLSFVIDNDNQLNIMAEKSKNIGRTDAAEKIINEILNHLQTESFVSK